jgi:urease beta subunit
MVQFPAHTLVLSWASCQASRLRHERCYRFPGNCWTAGRLDTDASRALRFRPGRCVQVLCTIHLGIALHYDEHQRMTAGGPSLDIAPTCASRHESTRSQRTTESDGGASGAVTGARETHQRLVCDDLCIVVPRQRMFCLRQKNHVGWKGLPRNQLEIRPHRSQSIDPVQQSCGLLQSCKP